MDNLYVETVYFSNIKAHVRIYKDYDMAEIYFYQNNDRLLYKVEMCDVSKSWYFYVVYKRNSANRIKKYPLYVDNTISAVANIIKAHINSEISLWQERK